jgi:hypothetical protein
MDNFPESGSEVFFTPSLHIFSLPAVNRPGTARRGVFFAAVCVLAVFLAACDNLVNEEPDYRYGISVSVSGIHTLYRP